MKHRPRADHGLSGFWHCRHESEFDSHLRLHNFTKVYKPLNLSVAQVVELVDTQDLKSCRFGGAGSIPALGTRKNTARCFFVSREKVNLFTFVGNRKAQSCFKTLSSCFETDELGKCVRLSESDSQKHPDDSRPGHTEIHP